MYILVIILGAILSVSFCVYGIKKKIIIEFTYNPVDWIEPIFLSLGFFVSIFLLEYVISMEINDILPKDGKWSGLVIRIIKNGILVIPLSMLLSVFFEKIVEKLNLDYLDGYSEMVSKICFSVIVTSVCVIGMIKILNKNNINELEKDYFINRCLMWLITVIGTWIGFGFGCDGRIKKENKKREACFETYNKVFFWMPIIVPLVIAVIIVLASFFYVDTMSMIINYGLSGAISFLIVGLCALYILNRIYNPSEKQSTNDFYKCVKLYNKNKYIKRRFGLMTYTLLDGKMLIDEVNISYPGHESDDDFRDLFCSLEKEINFSLDNRLFDDERRFLTERNRRQKEYIKKGYNQCIEDIKEKKMNRVTG